MVLTVLGSFLGQSCLVFIYNVTSALEVFLNVMRYINQRFTYLLTYMYLQSYCRLPVFLLLLFFAINKYLYCNIVRLYCIISSQPLSTSKAKGIGIFEMVLKNRSI